MRWLMVDGVVAQSSCVKIMLRYSLRVSIVSTGMLLANRTCRKNWKFQIEEFPNLAKTVLFTDDPFPMWGNSKLWNLNFFSIFQLVGSVGQDLKQNKQIKEESWLSNDISLFIILRFTCVCPSEKLSKVWQKVQYILKKKSQISRDGFGSRIRPIFLSFRKTRSVLFTSLFTESCQFYMVTTYQNIPRTSIDPI